MKKILFAFAGILLIALIGFYFYANQNKAASASLWDFVPADAAFVYENKKPAFPPASTPDFAAWLRRALRQDSVFISPAYAREVLVSLHITGKEEFGVLYYESDSSLLKQKEFKKLLTSGNARHRNFEGYPIVELPAASGKNISYIIAGKTLIVSRDALLIEDVIRSLKDETDGFRKKRDELFHLMPADAGQGKLYANINAVARFAGLFLNDEIKNTLFKNPVSSVITDARIENHTLSLNGFATDTTSGQGSMLSLFNDQRPVASEIQKTVSNRALLFVHYGIPDYPAWNKRRLAWSGRQFPEIQKSFQAETLKTPISPFYQCLGNEAGYCYIDGTKGQTDELFIVKIKPPSAEKLIGLLSGEPQPAETYTNYPIHNLTSPAFLQAVFWPVNENKKLTCYTRHDPYFFFAENPEVLKGFINDIEEDNTWGKSAEWNDFFNATSLETNLSAEFNGELLLPWMMNKFTPRWDSVSFPRPWGVLKKGAFQLSRLNYNYYFNGVLQFDAARRRIVKPPVASEQPRISFAEEITSLTLVRNHSNNAAELLVQTADKSVSLLGSDLKPLFEIKPEDKILNRVVQIDYYKNKKLQYLFLAGRRLYLIDRLGHAVKGFPKEIETPAEPEFLSVLDYDNSKNYRFVIADQKGNLLMMDKDGKLLEGWDKRTVQSRLTGPPRLIRSDGKDLIICTTLTGTVHVLNRKGESVKGFPASSGIHLQGDWFFDNSGDGLITMVSSEGVKIQINLAGKIVIRENYVRAAASSRFSMMISPTSADYAISRIDKGKMAVLNRKGEVLFERENPGSEVMEATYLLPAAGEKIFSFRDAQQDFTYLFNEQGNPAFNRPIESTLMPVMIHKQKEGVMVFGAFHSELKKYIP